MDPNLKAGVLSNTIGSLLLLTVGYFLGLLPFAVLSLVLQWFVYFVHGLPQQSEKFYDASGSVTYLALILSSLLAKHAHNARAIVNCFLVVIWCTRLGSFLFARILKDGKDSRFDTFKKHWLRFLGVWTVQAVWVFLVASPALVASSSEQCLATSTGVLDIFGWATWVAAFLFEVIADAQKGAFRGDSSNAKKFITSGLWAYSRHPNYFGEICMWIGICISGSSCFKGAEWLAWISPLTTYVLLMKVSGVPLLEKRGEKEWGTLPEYRWYMDHTPCILPALTRPPVYKKDD
eukprot:TRINITY_DN75568_c0_g1_i1.p1 TRINITY_DN75568_c0_g1~~TRINITY_DN75568_c0_g1_i1.p1  ORF type:complete len:291 (-),score=50.81 TRINITY_DN75568_c0_g1_i1:128-1000(-)